APVALLPWLCTKLVAPFLSSSFAPGIAAPLASVTVPTSAPADAVCAYAGVKDKVTRNVARTAKLKRKPRIMTRPSFSGGSSPSAWVEDGSEDGTFITSWRLISRGTHVVNSGRGARSPAQPLARGLDLDGFMLAGISRRPRPAPSPRRNPQTIDLAGLRGFPDS